MRPLTVITAIFLGSSLAITISLAAVLFVFVVLDEDYPRLQHEFGALTQSFLIFLGMTAIAALSFYTMFTNHRFKLWGQAALWAGLAATTWYYLP